MPKWTVALHGYYKPRYELREKQLSDHKPIVAYGYHNEPYYYNADSWVGGTVGYSGSPYMKLTPNPSKAGAIQIYKTVSRHIDLPTGFDGDKFFVYDIVGWEKRAEPGDIIACKCFGEDWSVIEKIHFLPLVIDGPTSHQMAALCESYWDTSDYKEIDPTTISDPIELFPQSHIKKRRFHIPLSDLTAKGVDLAKMLDQERLYAPTVGDIGKLECYDKLSSRYVLVTDNLRLIDPVIIEPQVKVPD